MTRTPATLAGIYDKVGSIETGKLANFLISSGPIFDEKTVVYQNWVQGTRYTISDNGWNDYRGNYKLTLKQGGQTKEYNVEVKGSPNKLAANIQATGDSVKNDIKLSVSDRMVKMNWSGESRQQQA